jgi:hypothetical protein
MAADVQARDFQLQTDGSGDADDSRGWTMERVEINRQGLADARTTCTRFATLLTSRPIARKLLQAKC